MNSRTRKTSLITWLTTVSLVLGFFITPTKANAATVYKYEWMAQSGNVSKDGLAHEYNNLQPGQTINLSLTMINRSGTTIKARSKLAQSPDKQVPVGVWGIGSQTPTQDGTPSFLDSSSFVLNNNRFVYYDGENTLSSNGDTLDGFMIHFSWTIKLKNNLADGVYKLYIRPVCEYLAWARQVKNGKLLPTTSSDIFWKFRVGGGDDSDVPTGYVRYVNPKYGFSFVYKQPTYPTILYAYEFYSASVSSNNFSVSRGVVDSGSADVFALIHTNQTLSQVLNSVGGSLMDDGVEYTKQDMSNNGISWTVFKYHMDRLDANAERRIGRLPNGYVIDAGSFGIAGSEIDQTFLNSVKPITTSEVYTNDQYGFKFSIPNGYKAVVYNPQYELFDMGVILKASNRAAYEDDVAISINPCSLSSDPGACLLLPEPPDEFKEAAPRFNGYLTIGGKKAVCYDGTTGGSYFHYYVFDGKSYKFEFTSLPNSTILDGIISSFQFI